MRAGTFPSIIDSTALADFNTCKRRFFISTVKKKVPMAPKIDLHAGGAFAAGLHTARQAFMQGTKAEDAIFLGQKEMLKQYGKHIDEFEGIDTPKTLDRLIVAFYEYFEKWPLDNDHLEVRESEFSFALELHPELRHPETGDPILFAGRVDMLAYDTRTTQLAIVDEKTTKRLGQSWFDQWPMRGQFLAYCWAAQQYGYNVNEFVVRGIAFLKTRIDLAEVLMLVPQWRIEEWYKTAVRNVAEAIAAYKHMQWPKAFSPVCSLYGGCPYKDCCLTPDSELDDFLDAYYADSTWSPLEVAQ